MALDSTPDGLTADCDQPTADSGRGPIPRRFALLAALVLVGLFALFDASGAAAQMQHEIQHALPGLAGECGGG